MRNKMMIMAEVKTRLVDMVCCINASFSFSLENIRSLVDLVCVAKCPVFH